MKTDLNNVVNILDESPLFHFSLGSKELFHSDFLEWISNEYKKQIGKHFLELLKIRTDDLVKIEREKNHTDINLSYQNGVKIIIENKLKSIPEKEQLIKYSKKFPENTYFILLSLYKPDFIKDKMYIDEYDNTLYKWKFLGYYEYIEVLKKLEVSNEYHKYLLKDYIIFIENLIEIDKQISIGSEYLSSTDITLLKKLKLIRFHDYFHKKRSNLLIIKLHNILSEFTNYSLIYVNNNKNNVYSENKIYLKSGFASRGKKGLFEFKVALSKKIVIGVQIEGFQYRHYIHSNGSSNPKFVQKTADNLLKEKKWFQFINLKKQLSNNNLEIKYKGRNNPKYYSYQPDFFYRRVDLPENVKTLELLNIIKSDSVKAINLQNCYK